MSLNIKDPETHKLARTLARETGQTMTSAVTDALRQRLFHIRQQHTPETTAAELLAIGRRCASALKGRVIDHGKLLYDKRGLPR